MSSDKPVFIFIFPDCMGGVASFNRNIINYASLRNQCIVKVILLQSKEDTRFRFADKIEADAVIPFPFSTLENQYEVCKRLHGLFGDEPGCIVTDNYLPLNAVGLMGSRKKVIYLVHDYFYINWAFLYHSIIDAAVAHSSFFRDILYASSPTIYKKKAYYIPYGVELPASTWRKQSNGAVLNLLFLGRLVEEKGIFLLKSIDEYLQAEKVPVQWTIVGRGPAEGELKKQWAGSSNITFIQAEDTQEVYRILENQDMLVFPSRFEGTPVAIMEAMSRGAVPVVGDLPGGTRDMVTEETGVRCEVENAVEYAKAIQYFYKHPEFLKEKQQACIKKSQATYNINNAADAYFSFLFTQAGTAISKQPQAGLALVSRLDNRLWPNWFVYNIRKIKKQIFSK
jgi:glycosyltransferase involved in cell wall biosynthesis